MRLLALPRFTAQRLLTTWLALGLVGCAASPPRPVAPPARTEIVVDEATVVQARAPGSREPGGLPPLPQALGSTSTAFQRGYALAGPLLEATGPVAPPDGDQTAYDGWLKTTLAPWLDARGVAVQDALRALGAATDAAPAEHVVAAALVGLIYSRAHEQLLAVPAPPAVRSDEKLLHIYQDQVNQTSASWVENAVRALRACAVGAAGQTEPAYGLWLELCQQQLAVLQQRAERAAALHATVAAEREAERLAAEGPRPPGPEMCWTPSVGQGPVVTASTADEAREEPPQLLSPRDLRYGARDVATSVRLSVALADNPTMDARPLGDSATRARLCTCFAKLVPAAQAITVALHASLSLDPKGVVRDVMLTPETSDQAAAPSKPLLRCLQRTLEQTAFEASPSGQATQASASLCLRRD